jgi:hypothetical protein
MKEALSSSETSVFTRVTWRNIPEDTILYCEYIHASESQRQQISQGYSSSPDYPKGGETHTPETKRPKQENHYCHNYSINLMTDDTLCVQVSGRFLHDNTCTSNEKYI